MTTTLGSPRNPVPRAVVEPSATNRGGSPTVEERTEVNPAARQLDPATDPWRCSADYIRYRGRELPVELQVAQ
jgi:hypothetical protein